MGRSPWSGINRGLVSCRYAIVVLSKAFLAERKWTEHELGGLFAREELGTLIILPIWHGITREDILRYDPALADRLAKISNTDSHKDIVSSVLQKLGRTEDMETANAERVECVGPTHSESSIPDAPQYWQQRRTLASTPVFERICERPRWCIWVRPAEFKPARFRNLEQCSTLMRRFTGDSHKRYPIFRQDLLNIGRDFIACEQEERGKFHHYLQCWALFRSAQFVHNLALDDQVQLNMRTHSCPN